jgi:hypothetical protein
VTTIDKLRQWLGAAMKKLISAVLIAGAVGGAELPSSKAAEGESSKPSCFSSAWDYLKSSVKNCPLRYGPKARMSLLRSSL